MWSVDLWDPIRSSSETGYHINKAGKLGDLTCDSTESRHFLRPSSQNSRTVKIQGGAQLALKLIVKYVLASMYYLMSFPRNFQILIILTVMHIVNDLHSCNFVYMSNFIRWHFIDINAALFVVVH